jgi:hypothetical protein
METIGTYRLVVSLVAAALLVLAGFNGKPAEAPAHGAMAAAAATPAP